LARILVLNGPNLNALGRRPAEHYGSMSLEQINQEISRKAAEFNPGLNLEVEFFQSNTEGMLVDRIQEGWGNIDGIIINPGALTHYGYSLKDALIDAAVPVIEVHLSNIHGRERWRSRSIIADVAQGQIAGFGWRSYTAAIEVLAGLIQDRVTGTR
jgi:3-dehydroquinate dehydratase-2